MKRIHVHVEEKWPPTEEEDQGVAGVYAVDVPDDMPDDRAAGVALDVFHSNVAIDCLDDFEVYATNAQGEGIYEPDDYEGYSGSNDGVFIGEV